MDGIAPSGDPAMKRFLLAAAAAAFALLPVGAALAGDGAPARHPHFDDGGALSWSTKLADAQKEAKKSGKLIFIEYGRMK
jgi:hypothetical protein